MAMARGPTRTRSPFEVISVVGETAIFVLWVYQICGEANSVKPTRISRTPRILIHRASARCTSSMLAERGGLQCGADDDSQPHYPHRTHTAIANAQLGAV